MPGQMQITSMPQQGGMSPGGFPAQAQGWRSGVPQGGMGQPFGMRNVPAQPQMGPTPYGGGMPQFGGGMGGGGMIPPQFGGMIPQMSGNALGGVQPHIQRPDRPNGPGQGFGGHDVRAFIDAIRGWIGQRPDNMTPELRQEWIGQRPDFWSFMNQQQQQAASTPPMAAPTVI